MDTHKIFRSHEFTNRDAEKEQVDLQVRRRTPGVVIYEGDRGAGKTCLLFELFRILNDNPDVQCFLVSLMPYQADEFADLKNVWLAEDALNQGKVEELLAQISEYFEITPRPDNAPDMLKEYLARGLAQMPSGKFPVLLVDSIYECDAEVRNLLERLILIPIISSDRALVILSGRGRQPTWSHPGLRSAEVHSLAPFTPQQVSQQLANFESPHTGKFAEIHQLSAGYPLMVRLLGQDKRAPSKSLNEAIEVLVRETLPSQVDYQHTRQMIEKLVLIQVPFRPLEIEDYLYPSDEDKKLKTKVILDILLKSNVMRYEQGGYKLNDSIRIPILEYLKLFTKTQKTRTQYANQLKQAYVSLANAYSDAREYYEELSENISARFMN